MGNQRTAASWKTLFRELAMRWLALASVYGNESADSEVRGQEVETWLRSHAGAMVEELG